MNRNYNILRGKIKEKVGYERVLAKKMGCTNTTLSNKLNGHVEFKQGEIVKICELLEISPENIPLYFFS